MRTTTLAMFIREGKLLLGMKKRGFGVGKWNGYGGKLFEGETPEEAAVREIREESGITLATSDLTHLGTIDFYYAGKPDWDQQCMVYRIDEWNGEAVETEEMRPEWFAFADIPYESMWVNDPYWLPHLLAGEKFTAEFHFDGEGKKIEKQKVFTF